MNKRLGWAYTNTGTDVCSVNNYLHSPLSTLLLSFLISSLLSSFPIFFSYVFHFSLPSSFPTFILATLACFLLLLHSYFVLSFFCNFSSSFHPSFRPSFATSFLSYVLYFSLNFAYLFPFLLSSIFCSILPSFFTYPISLNELSESDACTSVTVCCFIRRMWCAVRRVICERLWLRSFFRFFRPGLVILCDVPCRACFRRGGVWYYVVQKLINLYHSCRCMAFKNKYHSPLHAKLV